MILFLYPNFLLQNIRLFCISRFISALTISGTVYVSKFSNINLTCNATGAVRAPEDIDWFHDGQKIRQNAPQWRHRTYIYKYQQEVPGRSLVSTLTVERSEETDAGTYICRSSDKDTESINVHVLNGRSGADCKPCLLQFSFLRLYLNFYALKVLAALSKYYEYKICFFFWCDS